LPVVQDAPPIQDKADRGSILPAKNSDEAGTVRIAVIRHPVAAFREPHEFPAGHRDGDFMSFPHLYRLSDLQTCRTQAPTAGT